jgi:hypothetical protein
MSSPLRIALVAEGVTDFEVLRAAVEVMLDGQRFDLKLLQPEGSIAFTGGGAAGPLGGGWTGVYKWMRQAVDRAGKLSDDPIFLNTDLLILHLDADVAGIDPSTDANPVIAALAGALPCEVSCPPPSDTTDRLRRLMLNWVGEVVAPARTVLCTPSKSTEAWVMAIFFPNDKELKRKGVECHPDPASRLPVQPKAARFIKSFEAYRNRNHLLKAGWIGLTKQLTEARRFNDDFVVAVASL